MSEHEKFLLTNLFDILSPRGMSKLNRLSNINNKENIEQTVRKLIIDKPINYDEIRKIISDYYLNKQWDKSQTVRDNFTRGFHSISLKREPLEAGMYDDLEYWKSGVAPGTVPSVLWTGIFGDMLTKDGKDKTECEVCVIVVRDPYMTPADANTDDIELFLNYMPSVVVNQMVPYLEVELSSYKSAKVPGAELADATKNAKEFEAAEVNNLNTPSLLRFLIGSVAYSDGKKNDFSDADRALIRSKNEFQFVMKTANKGAEKLQADIAALNIKIAEIKAKSAKTPQEVLMLDELTARQQGLANLAKPVAPAAGAQPATDEEVNKHPSSKVSIETLAGMEMFLAPQSLTNMDKLSSGRLMAVKPFLPFASIISFDVNIVNAGAGAMAHKTGKLQIKVHDKSRIAEFSEFIKGPAGFAPIKIWTAYGWLCPRTSVSGLDDEYAKLVNESMFMNDCWSVKNTQFTIDPTGGVILNLDLVGFGVSKTKTASIKLQDNDYESYVRKFQEIMEEIEELSRPIKNSPIGPDARVTQILNAGATGNMLPDDIKDPEGTINAVINAYIKSGVLTQGQGSNLINKLLTVLNPYASKTQLSGVRAKSIVELLTAAADLADPFIPIITLPEAQPDGKKTVGYQEHHFFTSDPANNTPGSSYQIIRNTDARNAYNRSIEDTEPGTEPLPVQPDSDYFNTRYIKELNYFINQPNPPVRPPKAENPKDKNKGKPEEKKASDAISRNAIEFKKDTKKIISFGKLFTKLAVPAILNAYPIIKADTTSEVQIIFYVLNDECGPVSGQSIAEFPIDLQRLSYAIDDLLATKNKYDFTIDEFLKIVINNQFNDDRSIGYGMLSKWLFKPFDKNKTGPEVSEKNQAYESAMAAWQAENSGFRKPMIEMFIETTQPKVSTAKRIHKILDAHEPAPETDNKGTIIRIHIYDKQNNPRKLFTQIIEMGEGFQMGSLNDAAIQSAIKDAVIKAGQPAADTPPAAVQPATKKVGAKTPDPNATAAADAAAKLKFEKANNIIKTLAVADIKAKAEGGNSLASSQAILKTVEETLGTGQLLKTPSEEFITKIDKSLLGPNGIRAQLSKFAPTLFIGSNGTLIKTVQLQSKTDDLMASANLVNIMKPKGGGNGGSTSVPSTGLEGPGGLPIRTVPAELTMTTMGCPALRLYQQFFVDLGTGTSLDNLYQVKTINHKISPGKFDSTLTFMYTNGYGKFTSPPSVQLFLKKAGDTARKLAAANAPKEEPKKQDAKAKTASPGTIVPDDTQKSAFEAGAKNFIFLGDNDGQEADKVVPLSK